MEKYITIPYDEYERLVSVETNVKLQISKLENVINSKYKVLYLGDNWPEFSGSERPIMVVRGDHSLKVYEDRIAELESNRLVQRFMLENIYSKWWYKLFK